MPQQTTPALGPTGSRLLEREDDLARMRAALEAAAAGSGQTLVVEGAAGAGKSVLVGAAAEIAGSLELATLNATGREIEDGFAFGVAIQLFAPLVGARGPSSRGELFSGAAELARPLLEHGPDPASRGEVHSTLHGLHWLCVNLCARGPLAICVDDAHWADEPSAALLSYLAARITDVPICLIVSTRSGETERGDRLGEALVAQGAIALRPAPLSEPAVGRLAAARLAGEPSERLVRECAQATGGNPLFVRELLRELVERGEAMPAGVGNTAPESVARIVIERLRRLPDGAGEVVRALAILGDGAEPRLLAHLSGIASERVEAELDRLIAAGLLERELPPRFAHPIVRQAVYGSIAPAARARGHLIAARKLAGDPARAELVGAHLLATEGVAEPAGAEAIEALRAAARAARDRGAGEQAARFLARALDEELGAELRRELLLELGNEELRLGREISVERLHEAQQLSTAPGERAEAALVVSIAQSQTGAIAEAVATSAHALEELGEGDRELWLGLMTQWATATWLGGTMTGEEHRRLQTIEREVEGGETPAERLMLAILAAEGAQRGSRPASRVSALAASALGGGRLLADLGAEHPSYVLAVAAQTLSGDITAAIEHWSEAIEDSRRRGSLSGYGNALFSRAYANQLAGDVSAAEADVVEGLELLPETELIAGPLQLATAAQVAAERGGLAPAHEEALEAVVALGDAPTGGAVNYTIVSVGWLELARGDAKRALARFEQTGRRAERAGMSCPAALPWRSGAARALHLLGREEEALALVEEELGLARAFEAPGPIGISLRHLALVCGPDRSVETAREAVATLERSEAVLEHAKSLIGLGMALRRAGAAPDAREPLREGMDLANRCGSEAAIGWAMEELRAIGMRPHRPALRGAEALSPQERQTARLAAAGPSNREIAEAMFLTRRTVEMHLTSAYRKLEISSREELAAALEGALPRAA